MRSSFVLCLLVLVSGCRGSGWSGGAVLVTDAGPQSPDSGPEAPSDAGSPPLARDAGPPPMADAGAPPGDAGPAPDVLPSGLRCEPRGDSAVLVDPDGADVATYESAAVCADVLAAAGDRVVCVYFTEDMPVGPGGWNERGWRAMNWETGLGLGRVPHESYEACLEATRASAGGVVCTHTGIGFKGTHVETNTWCGSSSSFEPCLRASRRARGGYVCSFPSDGDGTGPGWVLTRIGASCDYVGGQTSLESCNAMVP